MSSHVIHHHFLLNTSQLLVLGTCPLQTTHYGCAAQTATKQKQSALQRLKNRYKHNVQFSLCQTGRLHSEKLQVNHLTIQLGQLVDCMLDLIASESTQDTGAFQNHEVEKTK